jgi:hydroxymethylpyrimidine/phosphomethylpyrimidine kinase
MACGAFGTTAITAITAQNTHGVHDVHEVPVEFIMKQVWMCGGLIICIQAQAVCVCVCVCLSLSVSVCVCLAHTMMDFSWHVNLCNKIFQSEYIHTQTFTHPHILQLDCVLSDIGTDVVKTGMLSSAAIIKASKRETV